jgi:predicted RNase H-like HicB family nuclease
MKKHKEIIYQYEAVFEPNGAGYTVAVPKLPGLITEGDNIKEAREMVKDAIKCYLGALLKDKMLQAFGHAKKERVVVNV